MNKKMISIVLSMVFAFSLLSTTIFAEVTAPTITNVTVTKPNNYSIVVTGTSAVSQVTVRIIYVTNDNAVKLFDVENVVSGTFSKTVTTDSSWAAGDGYKVDVTDVNGTASQNFALSVAAPVSHGGGGGSSPTSTPSPTPTPTASPTPTPSASPEVSPTPGGSSEFVDVGQNVVWAEEAITELAKVGVVSGETSSAGEKIFRPEDKVTRAEFAKLIVTAFNLPEATDDANYSDVAKDDWFYKVVATASKLGIVKGYDGGVFDPNKEITREEMCVMLMRAAKAVGLDIPQADLTFDDSTSVSDFATTSIAGLAKLGIINGKGDNKFAPLDNATRAESAKVIYAIYKMFKAAK